MLSPYKRISDTIKILKKDIKNTNRIPVQWLELVEVKLSRKELGIPAEIPQSLHEQKQFSYIKRLMRWKISIDTIAGLETYKHANMGDCGNWLTFRFGLTLTLKDSQLRRLLFGSTTTSTWTFINLSIYLSTIWRWPQGLRKVSAVLGQPARPVSTFYSMNEQHGTTTYNNKKKQL